MTAVRQRTGYDCGVTSLAIFLTDRAARHVDPRMRGVQGLYNRELVKAAALLGITLRVRRKFDLDTDEGILRIRWNDPKRRKDSPYGHYVTVITGSIHCPLEHVVMPWRHYLIQFNATEATLLQGDK